jgi:hypothetical protein
MSDPAGFGAAPFDVQQTLTKLKRELRDLGLNEREGLFDRRGLAIARLRSIDAASIEASVVKRPQRAAATWQPPRTIRSSADARDFVAALRRSLAQWGDRDD